MTGPHADREGIEPGTAGRFGAIVLTVSTGVARGEREDRGAPPIIEAIETWGLELVEHAVVADDREAIAAALRRGIADERST